MGYPNPPIFQGIGATDAWFEVPTPAGRRVFACNGRTWIGALSRKLIEIVGTRTFGSPPLPSGRGGGSIGTTDATNWRASDLADRGYWNLVTSAALYFVVTNTPGLDAQLTPAEVDALRADWHDNAISSTAVQCACWLIAGYQTVARQAVVVSPQAQLPVRGVLFAGIDNRDVTVINPATGATVQEPERGSNLLWWALALAVGGIVVLSD